MNSQLHQEHQRVLLRYLRDERTLSHQDWVTLSEAVDVLSESRVVVDGEGQTFRRFYDERIDAHFADSFLVQLGSLTDVEEEGRRAQAIVAQEIVQLLDKAEGFSRDDNFSRLLLIYCLYWWAAFARGYIFEVVIFRDLTASGLQFSAHNLARRDERFSSYDLFLLDLRGDIKYTTYFLTADRLSLFNSDFFITRWYPGRGWLRVAILRETAWDIFSLPPCDDQRQIVTLDEVALTLPITCAFFID
ncbi:MAG: hypothetical protein ACREBD_33775, partial [Blastocatellia bacterium]